MSAMPILETRLRSPSILKILDEMRDDILYHFRFRHHDNCSSGLCLLSGPSEEHQDDEMRLVLQYGRGDQWRPGEWMGWLFSIGKPDR